MNSVVSRDDVCRSDWLWRSDIRHLKETRRHFEKISADMDSALVRNAQAARSKVQECDDAHNYLTAMTSGFYHTTLDYVFQVSIECLNPLDL